MPLRAELADAFADLFLGGRCAGCGEPGRAACEPCAALLEGPARPCWPDPVPPGMPPPWCVAEYADAVRGLLLAHKEHGRYRLARPLGTGLGVAVLAALEAVPGLGHPERVAGAGGWVGLVPVPSRRAVVRERGHDPVLRMARVAAVAARRRGVAVRVLPCLRPARRLRDQAGLDASARHANLAGALGVLPRYAGRLDGRVLVVADDIVTTGATATEGARALRGAGADVVALATVAATSRWQRSADADGAPA
jgi:predicted amidophosphoribosyltransferase